MRWPTSNNEEIKRYYSEWWENPKDIRKVVFDSLNQYVRQRIPPDGGRKALDIGSGHGRIVSYLVEKGYQVTAVEFNEEFAAELRGRFPPIKVMNGDVRHINSGERYDLITCIELVQNLNAKELSELLSKLATVTPLLLINMSNRNSFHGRWVKLRGFKASFVFGYAPREFERILKQAGFSVVHRRGIGLLTPVSLFRDFRGKLIPAWVSRIVNRLDQLFPRICHLYYIEAISKKYEEVQNANTSS